MNKTQLVEAVAQKTGLKKKDVETAVSAFVDVAIAALSEGEKVQISGLGTITVKAKSERTGRNPKTQEVITIPASKTATFTVSKTLKETLNK